MNSDNDAQHAISVRMIASEKLSTIRHLIDDPSPADYGLVVMTLKDKGESVNVNCGLALRNNDAVLIVICSLLLDGKLSDDDVRQIIDEVDARAKRKAAGKEFRHDHE